MKNFAPRRAIRYCGVCILLYQHSLFFSITLILSSHVKECSDEDQQRAFALSHCLSLSLSFSFIAFNAPRQNNNKAIVAFSTISSSQVSLSLSRENERAPREMISVSRHVLVHGAGPGVDAPGHVPHVGEPLVDEHHGGAHGSDAGPQSRLFTQHVTRVFAQFKAYTSEGNTCCAVHWWRTNGLKQSS